MARVAVAGSGTGRCKALMRSIARLFNGPLLKGLAGLQDEERQRSVDGRNERERSTAVVVAFFVNGTDRRSLQLFIALMSAVIAVSLGLMAWV